MRKAMLLMRYRVRLFWELPGRGSQKKEMMKKLLSGVEDFLEDHPEANYKTLTEHFGTPKQVAESYWNVNGGQAAHHTSILSAILKVILALALFAAVTWGIVVAYSAIDYQKRNSGINDINSSTCSNSCEYIIEYEV